MLKAFSTSLTGALAQSSKSSRALNTLMSQPTIFKQSQPKKSIASQYELVYQSPLFKPLKELSQLNNMTENILYAERKNKTARKVAKKHRKKKGKIVNMRRS